MRHAALLASFIAVFVISGFTDARADDWPQWRGPGRDGVWRETGVVEKLPGAGGEIPIKWRAPIGSGYSGPTVADGRVYVTDCVFEPRNVERVHCFDAASGRPVWSHTYETDYGGIGYQAGPRASVLVHDGKAYSLGAVGDLYCFDAATGNVLWRHDLKSEHEIAMPIWGIAASPIIEGDLLIVMAGGKDATLIAFDRTTGEERWRALSDGANYSAPIVIEQAGRRVLIAWTAQRIVALDPRNGELVWEHPYPPAKMPLGAPSPVYHNGYLYFTGFYDGSLMLRPHADRMGAEVVWHRRGQSERATDALHSIISTPYLAGDHIYGVDSYGELRCLDLATGDRIWEDRTAVPENRWATIHFVHHEPSERIFMFNEKGDLIIARLSPRGYQEISRAKLLEPTDEQIKNRREQGVGRRGIVLWSHPAYANRHIFARNDRELVCASLTAE